MGALLLFVGFCFVTPPGHAVLAALIGPLTGDSIAVSGLSGGLPNHVKARQVELRDAGGTWLRAEGVSLDWHFFSLIGDHVNAQHLHAERVVVLRREIREPSTTTSTTVVDINDISIARIELEPAVLSRRAVLTASGSLHYVSRHNMAADFTIRRLDSEGRYDVHASISNDIARGAVTIAENGAGLAGGIVGMPDIGALSVEARASATGSINLIHFRAGANLLNITGGGTIDLSRNLADVDFSAVGPQMHPNKQLSWMLLSARGHLHGPFAGPEISADLKLTDLDMGGNRIALLAAVVKGTGGKADLDATATGLHLAGDKAGILAATPVRITAHADLPAARVAFALDHPLLKLNGRSTTRTPLMGQVTATLPSLDRLTGAKLNGNAVLTLDFKQAGTGGQVNAKGHITALGKSALAKLLGNNAQLAATLSLRDALNLSLRASLKGAAASAEANGSLQNGSQDFSGELSISDLSRVAATLTGNLILRGKLTGRLGNGTLAVDGAANAATKGMPKQSVSISARASGLPNLKTASLRLSGRFDTSPLSLKADVVPAAGNTFKIALTEATWRSARAQGSIVLQDGAPRGTIALRVARLADLAPLIGTALSGSLDARSEFQPASATVHATATDIAAGSAKIGKLAITGTVANPFDAPSLALTVSLPDFSTSALSGSAEAKLSGPLTALAVALTSDLNTPNGQQLAINANTVVDTAAKRVAVSRFDTLWRDQTIRLAAPTTLDYSDGVKFAATFVDGQSARLDVNAVMPARGAMTMRANGTADLAVLGSGLAAVGQSVHGKLALNITVTGTTAKPQVVGSATLSGGQLQDYSHGVNLTNVDAAAEAQGSVIRLTKFNAAAGPGTISGSGTIDLGAPGTPVNIVFKGTNARPIVSDLLTANLDTDLKLDGRLAEHLKLSGKVTVRQGNINLPEKIPAEVATLNVRRAHQAPGPPPSSPLRVSLDLTLSSPGRIFVRGRGLEAEFEGELKIGGTTNAPLVEGALDMRRGTFSLAGSNLTFQSGKISFNGQALRRKLDPSLDLVAQTESGGITATLKVTGTASQPKIEISSSPSMPPDEILARLLFQQSAKSLSAMQLASVAQAAASLGGGGGGFDPVGAMRKGLGLDRLAVGSTPSANGGSGSTTVEAGKYILRNVYLGAKQDLSGGTRALVQVDLTKHLKAQAQVNTGPRAANTTSTPLQDNGDSIGLSYQFDY